MYKTEQVRAAPTWRLSAGLMVDRTNLMLRNLVAMQADVEAIGHGCMTDRGTLELMVELANVPNRRPIRGRFGHPGISENATGKQVMVSARYRIQEDARGTFLVHDAQLLAAARKSPVFGQDPIDYILTIAETALAEFAESVVIDAYVVWTRLGPNGEVIDVPLYVKDAESGYSKENPRPDDALTALPVLRPTQFYYTDFVNEGALTHHGLFSMDATAAFAGHSSAYARELFEVVDRWRAAYGIGLDELPGKVNGMLSKYVASRKAGVGSRDTGFGTDRIPTPVSLLPTYGKETKMAKNTMQFESGVDGGDEDFDLNPQRSATETKTDKALEGSQAALRQAEQLAANLSAGEQQIDNQPRFVSADEFNQLVATVDAQNERIRELSGQVRKTAELLARSMTSLAAVQRNMMRMDGEPVISQPVQMNGNANPLEPMQLSALAERRHPAPGTGAPGLPRHAASGGGQTAEQKAIEVQQRRARAARG